VYVDTGATGCYVTGKRIAWIRANFPDAIVSIEKNDENGTPRTYDASGNVMKKLGTVTLNQQLETVDGRIVTLNTTYQILQACILPQIWGIRMVAEVKGILDINSKGNPEKFIFRDFPGIPGIVQVPLYDSKLGDDDGRINAMYDVSDDENDDEVSETLAAPVAFLNANAVPAIDPTDIVGTLTPPLSPGGSPFEPDDSSVEPSPAPSPVWSSDDSSVDYSSISECPPFDALGAARDYGQALFMDTMVDTTYPKGEV